MLRLNQKYGINFRMPKATDDSRCRYLTPPMQQENAEMEITTFPSFMYENVCIGANNCLEDSTRWQFTLLLFGVSISSIFLAIASTRHIRPRGKLTFLHT